MGKRPFRFWCACVSCSGRSSQLPDQTCAQFLPLPELQRDQHRGIKEAKRRDDPFPTDNGTGCIVTVLDIDREWFQSVTVTSIRAKSNVILKGFIARPDLQITVCEGNAVVQAMLLPLIMQKLMA